MLRMLTLASPPPAERTVLLCNVPPPGEASVQPRAQTTQPLTVHADTVLQRVAHGRPLLNYCVNMHEGDGGPQEQRAVCSVRSREAAGTQEALGAGCLPPLPLPSVSSLCGFRWNNTVNFFLGSSSIQMHGNSEKGDSMAEADV